MKNEFEIDAVALALVASLIKKAQKEQKIKDREIQRKAQKEWTRFNKAMEKKFKEN